MFFSNSNAKRDKMSFDSTLIFVGTLKQALVNSDSVFQYNSRPWLVESRLVLTRTLKYRIAKYLLFVVVVKYLYSRIVVLQSFCIVGGTFRTKLWAHPVHPELNM